MFDVLSVAVFVIRDRFEKKADTCLNLYPCVIKYYLICFRFLRGTLFAPGLFVFLFDVRLSVAVFVIRDIVVKKKPTCA